MRDHTDDTFDPRLDELFRATGTPHMAVDVDAILSGGRRARRRRRAVLAAGSSLTVVLAAAAAVALGLTGAPAQDPAPATSSTSATQVESAETEILLPPVDGADGTPQSLMVRYTVDPRRSAMVRVSDESDTTARLDFETAAALQDQPTVTPLDDHVQLMLTSTSASGASPVVPDGISVHSAHADLGTTGLRLHAFRLEGPDPIPADAVSGGFLRDGDEVKTWTPRSARTTPSTARIEGALVFHDPDLDILGQVSDRGASSFTPAAGEVAVGILTGDDEVLGQSVGLLPTGTDASAVRLTWTSQGEQGEQDADIISFEPAGQHGWNARLSVDIATMSNLTVHWTDAAGHHSQAL